MKFIDKASIEVYAGKGGDGCLSFRRERFIPLGGPDGGDGGDGGNVYLSANADLNTLAKFRFKRIYKAKNGQPGMGQKKRGKSAEDLMIPVPLGTIVFDKETDECIGEITKQKQTVLVAKGGFHGLGNSRFKSSVSRAPRKTSKGTLGENRHLLLELKILADVGLLGLPNAGKSSFIRQISNATPKVAAYPFTTLSPNLAVVSIDNANFTLADIPGIITGAHQGVGLGIDFLKHLTRTKILLHIIDASTDDSETVIKNYHTVLNELKQFSSKLSEKPIILVFNKLDVIAADKQKQFCQKIIKKMNYKAPFFYISALSGLNCQTLLRYINQQLIKNETALDC